VYQPGVLPLRLGPVAEHGPAYAEPFILYFPKAYVPVLCNTLFLYKTTFARKYDRSLSSCCSFHAYTPIGGIACGSSHNPTLDVSATSLKHKSFTLS
jgi:hypothetical protein